MAPPTSSAETAAKIKQLLIEVPDPKADVVRLDELRKLFAGLVRSGEMQVVGSLPTDAAAVAAPSQVKEKWNTFLQSSHRRMVQQLMRRIVEGKRAAIRTFWGVVASSPVWSHNRKYQLLSESLLLQWIRAMSQVPVMDQSVRHMIEVEFIGSFRDVQYYAMIGIRECASDLLQSEEGDVEARAERLVQILSMIPISSTQDELEESPNYLFPPPSDAVPDDAPERSDSDTSDEEDDEDASASVSDEDNDSSDDDDDDDEGDDGPTREPPQKRSKIDRSKMFTYQLVRSHHRVWAKAWLEVLKLPLPVASLKQALQFLPQKVLPNVAHPLQFSDFFMSAYNNKGVVPVLALDGLFTLITEHGLEYKDFYKQLYRLVTPSLLYVKFRTRFFVLLDKCLSRNQMLPAHVVAAFCKRLLRCALQAPPSSILFVLALCSNLIRKHPEVSCLIHRQDDLRDGFDAAADDPELANALQSSLWELLALQRHYFPPVATLARSVGREEELQNPLHNLTEDFLGHTYTSLFDQERKRQRKGKTPLAFQEPESLFVKDDVFSGILAIPSDDS